MPTYQYEALDATGKPQRGALEAGSSEDAIQQIRGQGYFPTSVREQRAKDKALATSTDTPSKKKSFLSLEFNFGRKKKAATDGDAAAKKKKKGGGGGRRRRQKTRATSLWT